MKQIYINLTKYLQIYDPGYLKLQYALKAMVAISLSALVHYLIFGQQVLIWATMTPMQVFFLNATLSQQADRRLYMLGFGIGSALSVALFTIIAQKAFSSHETIDVLWLAIPVLLLTFMVGMSRAYSIDSYRMFVPVVTNSLVACIYVDSGLFLPPWESMIVVFSSAMFGIVIGFLLLNTAGNYGKYTQVYFPLVINNLSNMMKNMESKRDFNRYKNLTFSMIHNIKQTLLIRTQSNDSYMVKNIRRAIFYIYRIEDIYMVANVLYEHHIHRKYPKLISEIVWNLNMLSKIFIGRIPSIKREQADRILSMEFERKQDISMQNIIKILYYKFESFCRISKDSTSLLNPPDKRSLKNIIKAFDINNPTFRFAIKYSLAIALSLIFATMLNINRGIWISLGVISVVRPFMGGMQHISKEYFFSAVFGICVGIILSFFSNEIMFYLLFGFIVFLVVYLKAFPVWLWSGFMMCFFVMMYSIIYENFLEYVLDRIIDIGLGVIFAIFIFRTIFPRFSYHNLVPLLNKQLNMLGEISQNLINTMQNSNTDAHAMQIKYATLLHNTDELRKTLQDSKNEKGGKSHQIVVYGNFLMQTLELLNLKINELYHSVESLEDKEGCLENMMILKNRFDMLEALLNKKEYNFSTKLNLRDGNSHFSHIALEIFEIQNKLYKILDERHVSAP